MRNILTLVILIVALIACDKSQPIPPANTANDIDSTDTTNNNKPILKDTTLKFTGIDQVVEIDFYDSIEIPFTVGRDSGNAEQVTISVSGLSYRVRAKISQNSGTTPFSSSIKIYTYLVGGAKIKDSAITITATTTSGQQVKQRFTLKVVYNKNINELLYNIYTNSPLWGAYTSNPVRLVADGPVFHYNAITKNIYLNNLYVGEYNGKKYFTIGYLYGEGGNIPYSDLYFSSAELKCTDGIDTVSAIVTGHNLNYYENYGDDNTTPGIVFFYSAYIEKESNKGYYIKGDMKIDGFN